ncbi:MULTISPECIES: hypothetical protein [unclassified Streptomyces]|uniref:hypothetical protein n=1 Tax=Streptomyces sp. AM 3-1-1 TaxID=3028711 RepID=UPI0023B92756|nr:hypothetical protein [Streptomyces sp. AM 3-1-1]WEH27415.1 hypothetical protein P0D76_08800 [Streptomyces sp. AM 3-1-1]
MQPKDTYCVFCRSTERHVPLTENQQRWVREKKGATLYVGDLIMCAAGTCRKVRSSGDTRRFHPEFLRIPEGVD